MIWDFLILIGGIDTSHDHNNMGVYWKLEVFQKELLLFRYKIK
jgi:hypothetical protein